MKWTNNLNYIISQYLNVELCNFNKAKSLQHIHIYGLSKWEKILPEPSGSLLSHQNNVTHKIICKPSSVTQTERNGVFFWGVSTSICWQQKKVEMQTIQIHSMVRGDTTNEGALPDTPYEACACPLHQISCPHFYSPWCSECLPFRIPALKQHIFLRPSRLSSL